MAKADPFYSIRGSDTKVHHNNNTCPEGKTIESYARSYGTGDLPLCETCKRLNSTEPTVKTGSKRGGLFGWFRGK